MAPEGDLSGGIGLLAENAPIAQIFKLDRLPGNGAADVVAFRQDLKIGVEIAKLGFPPLRE